jgi:alpha-tubulin N-acetyltransferase 1
MLFDKMLEVEYLEAKNIAYDRPSNKLLKFLEKNFKLTEYVPQNNNFVVYDDYFENSDFNKKSVKNTSNSRKSQDLTYEFSSSEQSIN